MPIDINQLNTSPLAALAGGRVSRLGLEAYPIDIGAPAQGMAEGYWKAQDLQERYAQQNTLVNIEKMRQQGQLTTDQADNYTKAVIAEYNQKQANLRQQSINAIQQQNADTNRMNAGINQYNAGIDAQYKAGQLGVAQQNANQTGAYQQGQLAIGQGNLDVNKQKAQDDMLKNHFDMGLKMDDRKREGIAQVSALIGQIGQATNGDANKAMPLINNALAEAKKMGIDTSMFEGKSFNDMMNTSVYTSLLNQKVEEAKGVAAQKGLQITTDDNGNLITKPLQAPTELDKSLSKAYGDEFKEMDSDRAKLKTFQASTQQALAQLAPMSKQLLGPVAGWIGSLSSEQSQELDSTLKSIALQAKDIYKLGSGQGFTDTDREFLVSITGGLKTYKGSLQDILSNMQHFAKSSENDNWMRQYDIVKQSQYGQQWLKDNPPPVLTIQEHDDKGNAIGNPMQIPADKYKDNISEFAKNNWKPI